MSIDVSRREIESHLVHEFEPHLAQRAAAVVYEIYVDLVYHLTASPHDYEERLIDTGPDEQGLIGIDHLVQNYPQYLYFAARDVIEYSLQACNFESLPNDEDTDAWRKLEESIALATTTAHLDDVVENEWLKDLRGAPNPYPNRLSIRRLYENKRPVPLEELLGRRSLHPDIRARLEAVE